MNKENGNKNSDAIKLAVIIGGHGFPVPPFHHVFDTMPDVYPYFQTLPFFMSGGKPKRWYDAVMFHNWDQWYMYGYACGHMEKVTQDMKDGMEKLGESDQGIFVLHHALHVFRVQNETGADPTWCRVCNVDPEPEGKYKYLVTEVKTDIAESDHPITQGLSPWTMEDEVFLWQEPKAESTVLLKTDNPDSSSALGWVHQLNNARVFCYQSGHGGSVYTQDNPRTVIHRGIQWVANRL